MLILSQDKTIIVNLAQVTSIYISESSTDDESFDVTVDYTNDDYDDIGTYDTAERAKEVLKEIFDAYPCARAAGTTNKVYVMPEE